MPFTTSKANDVLQSAIPKTCYIGLHVGVSAPSASGSGFSEPSSSTGYTRVAFGAQNTSKDAQIANDAIIFFNETLAGYGTITHFGLFSSMNDLTPFFIGEVIPNVTINDDGYVPIFRRYNLIIGLDKAVLDTNY